MSGVDKKILETSFATYQTTIKLQMKDQGGKQLFSFVRENVFYNERYWKILTDCKEENRKEVDQLIWQTAMYVSYIHQNHIYIRSSLSSCSY